MTDTPKRARSSYAIKRASGRQMYGPNCCAHSIPQSRIDAAKRDAEIARRLVAASTLKRLVKGYETFE